MCKVLSKTTRQQIQTQRTTVVRGEAEEILRQTAFVLEMTRRVKSEMLAERCLGESGDE